MLKTEMRNEKTTHIDKMSTSEMLKLINEANFEAVKAVEDAAPQIEKAIDIITDASALVHSAFGASLPFPTPNKIPSFTANCIAE